jgi:diketogulonate reductase-like aldo/keto reductase
MQHQQLYTTLNNGIQMPLLGLGVYDMYQQEAEQAVSWALETGYRLIDTAAMYNNETEIGNAIRQSLVQRSDIFVTTKVHNDDQGFDPTLRAFDKSLQNLRIDYIDLYLVHWPIRATRKETWLALEKLYSEGRVKAIGVANYLIPFLDELQTYNSIVPAVNQVELSPYLFDKDLVEVCQNRQIQLQAYTPLVRGLRMNDPKLLAIATQYSKTPAQIILRWAIQHGISSIPKSANLKRLQENFNIFDFHISPENMSFLDGFNENLRVVEDPMDLF